MDKLLQQIKTCTLCQKHLPFEPKPVITASSSCRIVIIGQAPGSRVQHSGIPWDDPSGDLLREWMQLDKLAFYDDQLIALMPMGFCYPGKGKSGDLPPRPECAPRWHAEITERMSRRQFTMLIGQYSQRYYLGKKRQRNLTETVRNYKDYAPNYFPLPHPSPRNRLWLRKNPWFNDEVLPAFRSQVQTILSGDPPL